MARRSKIFRWIEEKSIMDRRNGNGATQLIEILWTLMPDMTIKPKSIDISCGITDDPTDEEIIWALIFGDPENLPLLSTTSPQNLKEAIWTKVEAWRSIGTDAGPTEVMDDDTIEALSGIYTYGGDDRQVALLFMTRTITTSSMLALGRVVAEIEYRQLTWNDDGSEMGQSPANIGGAGV